MHKVLKFTGILLGILVLLALVGIIFLVTFVSPNRLKPVLTDQVMKYTGRQLAIDGEMSWTFFPYLGVKVGHSTLSNPSDFNEKTFAEISHMTVGVRLMPLFSKKIESSGIVLDGMKLHLIKNKNGKVNWAFNTAVPAKEVSVNEPSTGKKMALGLVISGLDVTNAAIDYADDQAKKYYTINHFELHAKDINLLQSFPIQSSFDFTANSPAVSGHAALKGDVLLQTAAEIYTFRHLDFTANIKQGTKTINMNVSGDLIADLNQQTLQWTGFKAKVANIEMTGKLNVNGLRTNPVTTAELILSPFDLKQTLQMIGQEVPNLQTAKSVKGHVDVTADANGVKMQGNLGIDTLQAAKLTMTDISVNAHFQKGVLDLAPFSAKCYQGNLTGQTIVNLNSSVPQITAHAKLVNVQAQPLMEDVGGKDQKIKLAGLANFEMQITTAGTESKAILQNLNGVSQFTFNNGKILGVDLGYLVDSAYAFIKHQPMTATNTDQTSFGTLSGTAVIRSGVINNNDLSADTPRFAIRGAGTIDLVNQKIDYALQTSIKQRSDQKDNAMNLYGITLPVLIKGNLNGPSIRLDSGAVAKAIAEQQLNKVSSQAKEKLQEQIKKQIPADLLKGKAGDVLNNLLGK